MKFFKYILFFCMISIVISCGSGRHTHKKAAKFVVTDSEFYSPDSFINYETISEVFQVNNLDAWLVTTLGSKRDSRFSKHTKKLYKDSKNNLISGGAFSPNVRLSKNSLLVYDYDEMKPLPVQVRELNIPILFNVISSDYRGNLIEHFDSYFSYLDRGFIMGISARVEPVGPEWDANANALSYVWTNEKSNVAISQALRERRTFVSYEKDAQVDFQIDEAPIGSVIHSEVSSHYCSLLVNGASSKIVSASIITNNGEVLHDFEVNAKNFKGEQEFDCSRDFAYFFAKLVFENGNVAYTSPIWLIKKKTAVLANVSSSISEVNDSLQKKIVCTLENIGFERVKGLNLEVYADEKLVVSQEGIDVMAREIKAVSLLIPDEMVGDGYFKVRLLKDAEVMAESSVFVRPSRIKKILIDTYHKNMFADNLSVLHSTLEKKDYHITTADSYSYFLSEKLSTFDMLLMLPPMTIPEDAFDEIKLLYALHYFVYNGGNIMIVGSNDDESRFSVAYLNRILQILYSPVKFRLSSKNVVNPIYDNELFFLSSYSPVFRSFNPAVHPEGDVNEIYLRSPIELYAVGGGYEIPVSSLHKGVTLCYFNETTQIENRRIYDYKQHAPAVMWKFGKGFVCVISGVNFTDYDIANMDNKKWIMGIIDYMNAE